MLRSGLVSVTFRALPIGDIVKLASQAGLGGIEWGGDVHIRPGDRRTAREAAALCRGHALAVVSYGSYYRLGQADPSEFGVVLDTAGDLGAPNIRVWAGEVGSAQADTAYRRRVAADARRCAQLAGEAGLRVSLEYHGGTLTDSAASTLELLESAGTDNLFTYWQIAAEKDRAGNVADIEALRGRITNLHCHYIPDGKMAPLTQGEADWRAYLHTAAQDGQEHWVLIEFVAADAPDQLVRDADALNRWLAG